MKLWGNIKQHPIATHFALALLTTWEAGLIFVWLWLLQAGVVELGSSLAAARWTLLGAALISLIGVALFDRKRICHTWLASVDLRGSAVIRYAAVLLVVPYLIAESLLIFTATILPSYQTTALYERTYVSGRLHAIWAALRNRSTRLGELMSETAQCTGNARACAGVRIVPIAQICGSECRSEDFDDSFHPLHHHTAARWEKIAQARTQGLQLPPVELICLDNRYFVRDGHHRISVAKALGQRDIEALVTNWGIV